MDFFIRKYVDGDLLFLRGCFGELVLLLLARLGNNGSLSLMNFVGYHCPLDEYLPWASGALLLNAFHGQHVSEVFSSQITQLVRV